MSIKRLISLLLCLVLIVSCAFPLASCKKDDEDDKTPGGGTVDNGGNGGTVSGNTKYDVQVKTVGGMALEGVMVYVYKPDGAMAGMPSETDENGKTSFELPTLTGYTIKLSDVPEGYVIANSYEMGANGASITLASKPLTEGGFKDVYEVGDIMYDFTMTDINGVEYKLSEMLETKKMVMLNFWYVGCGNCALEFPYINAVYDDFSEDIEILAINDYPKDTFEDVEGYNEYLRTYYGTLEEDEELLMPLFKVGDEYGPASGSDGDLSVSRFDSAGWPTTVIIDRYGVVCMIEIGAVLGENKWYNVFSHFTADNYEQKLITDPSILNPIIEPTVQWTDSSASEIAGAFNSGDISVTYHPEESEKDKKYAWPFITDTFDGSAVVRPSNNGIDNSFSILYAEVDLKPGQAITFDYYAETQRGYDVMYVLVDGKDIYSISGDSTEDGWETCCTYVDPRPVTDSNKDDVRTYEVAFAYYKDDVEGFGADTVYLRNLKVIGVEDIEVETYIFRYAATDLNETGDGYNTYVSVYLAEDGYYHVGDPSMGTNSPLLLANLLSYTNFDSEKTVSERIYVNYELMVNGENKFNQWVMYGNYASNSSIPYYTTVTEELKTYLVEYCNTYRRDVGKTAHDSLWLQLCAYYDAYGKDEDGNPTKQLEDPIKGLATFSAFDVQINNKTPEKGDVIATESVTYNKVIMPRGYLYKFVPEISGVYRILSHSDVEVNGWIFIGSHDEWAVKEGDRDVLTHYDVGERYCEDLLIDPDEDGIYERDYVNTTLVAYMEAGKEYYIDIAYYDVYSEGTFTFDVIYVGESFRHFIQASNGLITYEESLDGGMGQLIAPGISYVWASALTCTNSECGELVGFTAESNLDNVICAHCASKLNKTKAELEAKLAADTTDDSKYAFQLKGTDGTYDILGMAVYADFYQPTTLFPSQSIQTLIKANAFNYTITDEDREALILLDDIRIDGKKALIKEWVDAGMTDEAAQEKWNSLDLDTVVKDGLDKNYEGAYTNEQKELADKVIAKGIEALKADWGADFDKNWIDYQMDDIINNCLKTGIFHNSDNRTDKDKKAQEYLTYLSEHGEDGLKAYWDAEFDSVVPPSDEDVEDVSEWRYNYFWNYYQMDDVQSGVFHGNIADYTETISKYVALMEDDISAPERQGCVAVTKELADILTTLIDREVFEDVKDGWLKFCYFYDILKAESAE